MKKYLFFFLFFFILLNLSGQITYLPVQLIDVREHFLTYSGTQNSASVIRSDNGDITILSSKENTKGSRYLLGEWAMAKIFSTDSVRMNTEDYVFNFDKMIKKLMAKKDDQTLIEVITDHVKAFVLIAPDEIDSFERVSAINNAFFIKLVKDNKKYSLYKSIQTKFQKANYYNDGIVKTGKTYDSYSDTFEYYVVFPDGKYKKVVLNKKSVKNTFDREERKLNQYFSNIEERVSGLMDINENFLKELIIYLNQDPLK